MEVTVADEVCVIETSMGAKDSACDRVEAMALVFLAAALIERCEVQLARLSTASTVLEEIEAFRQAAYQHILAPPSNTRNVDQLADAVRLAQEHVDQICNGWIAYGDENTQPRGGELRYAALETEGCAD